MNEMVFQLLRSKRYQSSECQNTKFSLSRLRVALAALREIYDVDDSMYLTVSINLSINGY